MGVYEKTTYCVGRHLGFTTYTDILIIYIMTSIDFPHSIPSILLINVAYPGKLAGHNETFHSDDGFLDFSSGHLGF